MARVCMSDVCFIVLASPVGGLGAKTGGEVERAAAGNNNETASGVTNLERLIEVTKIFFGDDDLPHCVQRKRGVKADALAQLRAKWPRPWIGSFDPVRYSSGNSPLVRLDGLGNPSPPPSQSRRERAEVLARELQLLLLH